LELIDLKQYRNNALVYISDNTLRFFMDLEQFRVTLLCQSKLNIFKSDLLSMAMSTVKQNKDLSNQWINLFEGYAVNNLLDVLFCKVVDKYFHMGCGQLLKDFKRDIIT
jgi:hypothetical protein